MRKIALVVGAILVVLLVAGGSFYGGMTYERTRQTNLQAQFFAERGFPQGGQMILGGDFPEGSGPSGTPNAPQGQGFVGRGADGTIESLEGDTLQLNTGQGTTTVLFTDQTVISRFVTGERSDLQPGERILVVGERDDSGNVIATSIQLMPAEP